MNRREFLKLLGAGAGFALGGVSALPLELTHDSSSRDRARHMLNRATFGPRPGQVEAINQIGLETWLEQQLDPRTINDDICNALLRSYLSLDETLYEMRIRQCEPDAVADELVGATILRAITSERQLFEVMVNFWSDHFSIYQRKGNCRLLKTIDDREVIRKHALGKFRDLLGASARSAAMLYYLNNHTSRRDALNDTYARALLELHTLGSGSYTEDDVQAVARAFTGWTFEARQMRRDYGSFVFHAEMHDSGPKTILGREFAADGGVEEGERVLDMLAAHPATARRIADRLCRRFIGDNPPKSIISAAARLFGASDGDIKAVVRLILTSEEFLSAPPKFKRPFEYFVSLCRALDVQVNGPARKPMMEALDRADHLPFHWPAPDGYSDQPRDWVGRPSEYWVTALALATGEMEGVNVDLIGVARKQGVVGDALSIITYFAWQMLGRALSPAEARDILDSARTPGQAVAMIAALPAFQYC